MFFTAAGDYRYSCEIHPRQMVGVVRVVEGASRGSSGAPEDDGEDTAPSPALQILVFVAALAGLAWVRGRD